MPEIEVAYSNSFEQKINWLKYNLQVSAYEKEIKGDLVGAIKDLSLAITDEDIDYDLYFERGSLFFKIKKYKEAKEDLSVFINSKDKHNRYRDHIKALFLKEVSKQKLNKHDLPFIYPFYYLTYTSKFNANKLIRIYQEFLHGLEASLKKDFGEALFHIKNIYEIDQNFLNNEKYLLDHLPKEMKNILDLCLYIV